MTQTVTGATQWPRARSLSPLALPVADSESDRCLLVLGNLAILPFVVSEKLKP